ncbi:MAG: translation initiation factor IF-5A [Nanoarchaeota archaeon]|nr:translation initiation factor IF-5A [Nanoarchaeota archaeon]MBU0962742.1 translation initiation factor IF-5A [Nanoarchaeota archaeon]
MSDIKHVEPNSLRVGNYVIIDGVACIIKKLDKSAPGKHGHAKFRVEASGIINNEKKIVVRSAHDKFEVPIIEKKSAQVLNISGDSANVMDSETFETFDIKIPEELKGKIEEGKTVTYWIVLDQKMLRE